MDASTVTVTDDLPCPGAVACVVGRDAFYSREAVESMSARDLAFTVLHELGHVLDTIPPDGWPGVVAAFDDHYAGCSFQGRETLDVAAERRADALAQVTSGILRRDVDDYSKRDHVGCAARPGLVPNDLLSLVREAVTPSPR